MPDDPYKILGVAANADAETIKTAFRALAKKYHPDAAGPVLDSGAFHRIRTAYELLKDARQRDQLDTARRAVPAQGRRVRLQHGEVQDVFDDIVDFLRDTLNVSHPSERTFLLKLDPGTARKGGKVAIDLPLVSTCPECKGTGGWRTDCKRCDGVGYFSETREVTIDIPPNTRAGDRLSVQIADALFTASVKLG